MKILAIESSCDETAFALVEDGSRVIVNLVKSQVLKHQVWGGVIPEMASRYHLEAIGEILEEFKTLASEKLGHDFSFKNDVDAIAVTQGPGLIGSLLVGVNAAKSLAYIHDKKIITVNHLHGHIAANYLYEDSEEKPDIEVPFLCLLVSGGHTQILKVDSNTEYSLIGTTVDDAAGEAFDKVARLLDLPYPGGPHLDKLAQTATKQLPADFQFQVPQTPDLDFSFSGLKTAALRMKQKSAANWQNYRAEIAENFQNCIAKYLVQKMRAAVEQTGYKTLTIAGGVAANSAIRSSLLEEFSANGEKLFFPKLKYCTDNAAMIAAAAYHLESSDDLSFEVFSRV